MNPEEARELYRFNSWANHRVIETSSQLTEEQFLRGLGSSFSSVRDTLVHILWGEYVWLERLNGRAPKADRFTPPPGALSAVEAAWAPIEHGQIIYVNSLAAPDFARIVEYRNWQGNPFAYSVANILKHVVNHSTYHRGQIATMVRQLGATPAATDFLRYFDFLAGVTEE